MTDTVENPEEKTEYIMFHTKEGDILVGHSPVFGDGEFTLQDVLALKEAYTPMSHIPVLMFTKYVPYSKSWSFRFKTATLALLVSSKELQESFILFYEWCRVEIKRDQDELINNLLISYMLSKGVDLTKLSQKPADNYLHEKFTKQMFDPATFVATSEVKVDNKTEEVPGERPIASITDIFAKKKKDDPTVH